MTVSAHSRRHIGTWSLALASLALIHAPGCDRPSGSEVGSSSGGTALGDTGGSETGGAAETGTGGSGGSSGGAGSETETGGEGGLCGEVIPYGVSCLEGVLEFNLAWSHICPDRGQIPANERHTCALGCREEGHVSPSDFDEGQEEHVWNGSVSCEDFSIRREGFPCLRDIDCLTPIGALHESNLVEIESGLGGQGGMGGSSGEEAILSCGSNDRCQVQELPLKAVGASCSAAPDSSGMAPKVTHSDECESGGCLVVEDGQIEGTCTRGCSTDGDCPEDYACGDAVDDRYATWVVNAPPVVAPPRVLVCQPR